jgi:hypothetical protein
VQWASIWRVRAHGLNCIWALGWMFEGIDLLIPVCDLAPMFAGGEDLATRPRHGLIEGCTGLAGAEPQTWASDRAHRVSLNALV